MLPRADPNPRSEREVTTRFIPFRGDRLTGSSSSSTGQTMAHRPHICPHRTRARVGHLQGPLLSQAGGNSALSRDRRHRLHWPSLDHSGRRRRLSRRIGHDRRVLGEFVELNGRWRCGAAPVRRPCRCRHGGSSVGCRIIGLNTDGAIMITAAMRSRTILAAHVAYLAELDRLALRLAEPARRVLPICSQMMAACSQSPACRAVGLPDGPEI